ncbi:MAG TPA: hypothetical protein PLL78_10335 [Fimbriimonadaceae bacterium]|nr:hypothetical protein [Fimbriimonadaceae bacterium]
MMALIWAAVCVALLAALWSAWRIERLYRALDAGIEDEDEDEEAPQATLMGSVGPLLVDLDPVTVCKLDHLRSLRLRLFSLAIDLETKEAERLLEVPEEQRCR